MRSEPTSNTQTDRFLGALVVVCASAVIGAVGAHAGSTLSSLFRFAGGGGGRFGDKHRATKKKSSRRRKLRRGRACAPPFPNAVDSDDDDDDSNSEREGEGDAYHVYAHGARSVGSGDDEWRAAGRGARERRGDGGDVGRSSSSSSSSSVLHVGSCHCGGLMFEVDAPAHLVAIEGPSKVCLCCRCNELDTMIALR